MLRKPAFRASLVSEKHFFTGILIPSNWWWLFQAGIAFPYLRSYAFRCPINIFTEYQYFPVGFCEKWFDFQAISKPLVNPGFVSTQLKNLNKRQPWIHFRPLELHSQSIHPNSLLPMWSRNQKYTTSSSLRVSRNVSSILKGLTNVYLETVLSKPIHKIWLLFTSVALTWPFEIWKILKAEAKKVKWFRLVNGKGTNNSFLWKYAMHFILIPYAEYYQQTGAVSDTMHSFFYWNGIGNCLRIQ